MSWLKYILNLKTLKKHIFKTFRKYFYNTIIQFKFHIIDVQFSYKNPQNIKGNHLASIKFVIYWPRNECEIYYTQDYEIESKNMGKNSIKLE